MAADVETLRNWIAGEWTAARGTDAAEVTNPASGRRGRRGANGFG